MGFQSTKNCGCSATARRDSKSEIAEAVATLTIGPYALFAANLAGSGDRRISTRADQLLNRKMRGHLIASMGRSNLGTQAMYLTWIERFAEIFLPPLLLADILLRRSPLTSLHRLKFITSSAGWVTGYKIFGRDDIPHRRTFFRFEKLIFHHLVPLVDLWSERTEISQAVIWGSVAKVFNDTLQTIEEASGLTERLIEARALLNEPIWPDGNENPLFNRMAGSARWRRKRPCRRTSASMPGSRVAGSSISPRLLLKNDP